MDLILVVLVLVAQFLVIGFLGYLLVQDRMNSKSREAELLNLLVAKHLPEFANCNQLLKDTPEGRVSQLKAQNDLAISTAVMERESRRNRGIPVT